MNKLIIFLAALAAMAMIGCASMNEAECVTADWVGIGYEDGALGRDASNIANHRSACAEYGVTPNMQQYMEGYEQGIAYFCRPENGYIMGRSGRTSTGLCPPQLASAFNAAYSQGRELFQLSSEINQVARTIESNGQQIESMREIITVREERLVADGTPQAERTRLLQEVRELEQEIGRLEAETLELERERAVLEQEYEELEDRYSRF